nr:MAG TPA: hypothetical protein [Caudoviricetes sp.]
MDDICFYYNQFNSSVSNKIFDMKRRLWIL